MPPDFVHKRHDIGICSTTKSTDVGLMLVQQKGVPLYRTITERYLKNQYYSGAPDYAALDPQNEIAIIMDDWRSGFGLHVADSADPLRYFSSIGMDMSNRGVAVAGQVPMAHADPDEDNVPTIVNDDMEIDGDATPATGGWDYSVTGVTRSNDQNHTGGGTYSLKMATHGQTTGQYLEGWTPRVEYTVTCWAYTANHVADPCTLQINDDVGQTSDASTVSNDWEQLTVTQTANVNAPYLRIELISNTDGGNSNYFDDAAITVVDSSSAEPYTGVTRAFAEYNDDLYYSLDKRLLRFDHTSGVSYLVWQYGANITSLAPFTDDKLYIALGFSTAYENITTTLGSDGSTTNTGTYVNFQFFEVVFTTADTMYGNDSNNSIRSTVDPSESGTDFSNPATTVGSDANDITGLEEKSGALYIAKQDTTYYLNSAGAVQNDLAPELKTDTSATSGKAIFLWKKKLYINAGDQILLETDGTTNTFRNPANYCTNLSDFVGAIQGLAGDGFWLFAIVDNGTEVEVLKGRDETINGTTSWVWHPFVERTLGGCEKAFVSNVYQKRLWISSTTSSDSLYYIPLPIEYGTEYSKDANRLFNTATHFITPWLHGGFKGENKAWIKATATLGHTYNTYVYYECWFQRLVDSATTWIGAGYFKGSSTQMMNTLYLAANTAGVTPVSPMLRFKITAITNATNVTPVLLSLDIRSILRPPHRKIVECAVRCADGVMDKQGKRLEGTSAAYIRTVLDEARDASWPFTFYDLWGTEKYGIVLPTDTESEVTAALKNENPEQYYYLRIQEVSLS